MEPQFILNHVSDLDNIDHWAPPYNGQSSFGLNIGFHVEMSIGDVNQ